MTIEYVPHIAGLYTPWEYGYARVLTPFRAVGTTTASLSWRSVDLEQPAPTSSTHDMYYVSASLGPDLPGFLRQLYATGHPVVFDVPYPWSVEEMSPILPYVHGFVGANASICQHLMTVTDTHLIVEIETYTNPSVWPEGGRRVLPAEMDALCIGILNEPLYEQDEDYRILVPALEQIRHDFEDTVFLVFFGECPAFLRGFVDMGVTSSDMAWHERGHFYHQLDIALFPHQMQYLDTYRVPLRLFEAGLSQAAVICSPQGQEPYVTASRGAWAVTSEQWYARISRYARSSQERYRVATAFESKARQRDVYRNTGRLARMWREVYGQLTHRDVLFLSPVCA